MANKRRRLKSHKRVWGGLRDRGDGSCNMVDWSEMYRDPPARADETPKQREWRERAERVNSYLRQLAATGTVDYDLVPGPGTTATQARCLHGCGRLATPGREDGLCYSCRGHLKHRAEQAEARDEDQEAGRPRTRRGVQRFDGGPQAPAVVTLPAAEETEDELARVRNILRRQTEAGPEEREAR